MMKMKLIALFIHDFKNFVNFVNCVSQILNLSYRSVYYILKCQYSICVNGARVFIAIKSGIFSNWNYFIICSLIIIIRMYSDKCDDIYEMHDYEITQNKNNEQIRMNNMVMLEIYKLKHNVLQAKLNSEIKIKLIMYEHDTFLYKLYDSFLDTNYILNHKYNQLLINKHIETHSDNLFIRTRTRAR